MQPNDRVRFRFDLQIDSGVATEHSLSGYQSGLEASWNRSVERGKAQGKGRDSTPVRFKLDGDIFR